MSAHVGGAGNAPTQRHRTTGYQIPRARGRIERQRWGRAGQVSMEWEDEEAWLRARIIRLRTILRYAKDPQVEIGLKEFIGDAEARLDKKMAAAAFGHRRPTGRIAPLLDPTRK